MPRTQSPRARAPPPRRPARGSRADCRLDAVEELRLLVRDRALDVRADEATLRVDEVRLRDAGQPVEIPDLARPVLDRRIGDVVGAQELPAVARHVVEVDAEE